MAGAVPGTTGTKDAEASGKSRMVSPDQAWRVSCQPRQKDDLHPRKPAECERRGAPAKQAKPNPTQAKCRQFSNVPKPVQQKESWPAKERQLKHQSPASRSRSTQGQTPEAINQGPGRSRLVIHILTVLAQGFQSERLSRALERTTTKDSGPDDPLIDPPRASLPTLQASTTHDRNP